MKKGIKWICLAVVVVAVTVCVLVLHRSGVEPEVFRTIESERQYLTQEGLRASEYRLSQTIMDEFVTDIVLAKCTDFSYDGESEFVKLKFKVAESHLGSAAGEIPVWMSIADFYDETIEKDGGYRYRYEIPNYLKGHDYLLVLYHRNTVADGEHYMLRGRIFLPMSDDIGAYYRKAPIAKVIGRESIEAEMAEARAARERGEKPERTESEIAADYIISLVGMTEHREYSYYEKRD